MKIRIKNKALKDTIISLERECVKKYGKGEFCMFGQIMIFPDDDKLHVNMGVFNRKEFFKLDTIIRKRISKEWEKTLKIKGVIL